MLLAVIGLAAVGRWGQDRYWWLPGSLKDFAGHLLWAAGLIAMIRPHWTTRGLALVTLAIVFGLEFSQMLRAGWLDILRNQPWARFVMIAGEFRLNDLVALSAGIIIAGGMDVVIRPAKGKK
jgi:hypothetical protein